MDFSPIQSPATPSLEARRLAPLGMLDTWDQMSSDAKLATLLHAAESTYMPIPWLLSTPERRALGYDE